MAPTTWRTDVRAALVTILRAQETATPTLLRKVHPNRPGSFGETPCAYVSSIPEVITHTDQTRTRRSAPVVVVVDTYRDNEQTGDLLDQLVDLLVDRFTDAVQQIPNTILELASITDTDVDSVGPDKTTTYRGVVFTFGNATAIMEGRQ